MTTIHTARLTLRPFTADDLAALTTMHRHPDVCRRLGDGHTPTAAETAARLEYYRQPLPAPAAIFAITPRETPACLLGTILLRPVPLSQGEHGATEYEIGWHLLPAHWGNGYATEAAQAMLARARAVGLRQVVAVTRPDNRRSQAVMQRLGMTRTGMTHRYYDTDTLLFTLPLQANSSAIF
ncbi:MAG: GNAT family N-acetyltransferase [Cardiobacterium sp.]